MIPFEVLYGQNPPSILSYLLGISNVQEVDKTHTSQDDILFTLKDNLVMDQNKMKKQDDHHHLEFHFEEGIKCSFTYNLIRIHPSKKTTTKIFLPSFMAPLKSSNILVQWITNWIIVATLKFIQSCMSPT
jgi:hypothetical protein